MASGDAQDVNGDDASDAVEPSSSDPLSERPVQLPLGNALDSDGAAVRMGAIQTTLVVVGGPQSSGKSTLISSIYERLQQGPILGLHFSWSDTLMGFEKVCHEGRDESGRTSPETLHTSISAGKLYYHLRLFDAGNESQYDLLMSDLSGENYEDTRKFAEACLRLEVLHRADHFVLLLDGERAASLSERHAALDEVITILRALHETGMLNDACNVCVVISKQDLIDENNEAVSAFYNDIEQRLNEQFANKFASLRCERVVARDPNGGHPPASGAENMLSYWLQTKRRPPQFEEVLESSGQNRQIDNYVATAGK